VTSLKVTLDFRGEGRGGSEGREFENVVELEGEFSSLDFFDKRGL